MKRHQDINSQIEAFFAKGGESTTIAQGQIGRDLAFRMCKCGCRGNVDKHRDNLAISVANLEVRN